MVIRAGNYYFKTEKLLAYLVVIYVLIMSGSVGQYIEMGTYQTVNMLVTVLVVIFFVIRKKRKTFLDLNISMLLAAAFSTILVPFLWNEVSYMKSYLSYFSLLLMPWLIVQLIDFDYFKEAYLRIIFIIALISIVLFLVPEILSFIPQNQIGSPSDKWQYNFYGIYAKYVNTAKNLNLNRNIGLFWEPGMYQGFILYAMLLKTVEKQDLKHLVYQLIMIVCVLTIKSTTGYVLVLPLALIYLFIGVEKVNFNIKLISLIGVFAFVIIVLLDSTIILNILNNISPGISGKIDSNNSVSASTRIYSIYADAYMVVKNPFGIGIMELDTQRNNLSSIINYASDGANVNTNLNIAARYGWLVGIFYLAICIKGSFRIHSDKLVGIIATFMCIIIINTEPHYLTLFFTIVFMYFCQVVKVK